MSVKITETKLGEGAIEIGIRLNGELLAVVTHPCAGAKWFVHRMGEWGKKKFPTKKAAIDSVYIEKPVD